MYDAKRLGRNTHAARARLGLTRHELADRAGVNYDVIGRIERGDASPSLRTALKVAEALGVSLDELVA